ncbi:S-adenosyl-L-methionine-dependent methyltransferase [Rickenella mellea]|uniref:S-adenosyl-L-methionine-dependent methyltransferase n=1 Tax=Rickenella mellea TaxID=50990 RepID=A0A4Y7QFD0_9AGAM|nr:S-adenosyl-L-methionine-dependent methyltransferase [Rickenella mellea]
MSPPSVTNNTKESLGRQYAELKTNYNLPNDAKEHQRLNSQHEVLKLQAGGNFMAPLDPKDVHDILDICSGGGQWAIEMAQSFPRASVVGIDISLPSLDPSSPKPPNCKFQQCDVTKPLPFPDASFDFVQMRTVPSIPDRTHVMSEITRILRPGGIIQLVEPYESFSNTLTAGGPKPYKRSPKLIQFDEYLSRLPHVSHSYDPATETKGKSWSIAPELFDLVSSHGGEGNKSYTNVQRKDVVLPVGTWPSDPVQKQIAETMASVQMGVIDGFRAPFIKRGILTLGQFDLLREEVREEVYKGGNGERGWEICFSFNWVWAERT